MTENTKQRPDDPSRQQDERLAHELESLYRRVASPDSTEPAPDIPEGPDRYYKVLQISPDVPLSDIHLAYEKMTSAWNPERYPHVPSWKETSTEKLNEINKAYEKLLLLHAAREKKGPGVALRPPLSTEPPSFAVDADLEETAPYRSNVDAHSGSSVKRIRWLLAPGAFIVVMLLLFFLWPTLYHYEAVRMGGKDYPLRINRLTTHTQYFNGLQWIDPPLGVEAPRPVPAGKALPPPPVEPTGSGNQNGPKSVTPPPAKGITPQTAPASLPVEPASIVTRTEPKPITSPPVKRNIRTPHQPSAQRKTGATYSIQISAYPARDRADALAKQMQAKQYAVRVEEASIRGKGQWYRVLLGQFENRGAALLYLKDHRIGEIYPGSFIQRANARLK